MPITTPSNAARTRIGCAVILLLLAAGCSGDAELAAANKKLEKANERIATLEAQLKEAREGRKGGKATAPKEQAPTPSGDSGKQWRYAADEDAMTGKKRYTAAVDSKNTVNFGFPYRGEQHGTLTLRTDPQHGKDVIFQIEKGQILCPSYQGCNVQVRFDDEQPVRFAASGPSDHSTEVIFINDYARFAAKLRKASRVRLAVDIYQNGAPAFEFDVSGFDAGKYQPKT